MLKKGDSFGDGFKAFRHHRKKRTQRAVISFVSVELNVFSLFGICQNGHKW